MPFLKRFDPHMQEVVRGASGALIIRVIGAGFGFLFNVLLARMLGAEGAGIYYLAFTTTTIATVAGRMGLDNALLRFTAAHTAMGEWSAVKGLYQRGIRLALLASGLATAAVMIGAPFLAREVFSEPDLATPLRWMSLAIVPTSLLSLHGELLKGLKRTKAAMLLQGAGVSVLGVLLLSVMGARWGVLGAISAYVLAAATMLVVGIYMWHRAVPRIRIVQGEFSQRLLLSTSFPLLIMASMDLVMNFTDTVVLGIFGEAADVGVYGVAMRTAMLTSFVLIAVNSIAAPKFAALHRQGDLRTLEAVAQNCAKLTTVLAAPALLVFVFAPGWVLQIFGEGFEAGATVLSILALGQFVNVAAGSVGYLLMMSGNERLMRNNITVAALLNLVLNLILVPTYGVIGAATATAVSLAIMNVSAAFLVYHKLGIVSFAIRVK